MNAIQQRENPEIKLVESNGDEVTLLIEDGQAMQGWESGADVGIRRYPLRIRLGISGSGIGSGHFGVTHRRQPGHAPSYRNREISPGHRAFPRTKSIPAASAGDRSCGFFRIYPARWNRRASTAFSSIPILSPLRCGTMRGYVDGSDAGGYARPAARRSLHPLLLHAAGTTLAIRPSLRSHRCRASILCIIRNHRLCQKRHRGRIYPVLRSNSLKSAIV